MASEWSVGGLNATDSVTHSSGHRLTQALDGLRSGRSRAATDADGTGEVVDEHVVFGADELGAADVVGAIGVVELFGELGEAVLVRGWPEYGGNPPQTSFGR